jgi:hypothetical protein
VIHLTLARRATYRAFGGFRFGGSLSFEEAWQQGIDHVAIAAGAGRPTIIDIANNLIRGIRKASDFLMGLQLTGAFKKNALSNLQARLPAVVIGGGLTGVDTATELMAYYPIQVEKTLDRYEALSRALGEAQVRQTMDAEELGILDEFVGHGRAVRAERARAKVAGAAPNFIDLIRGWGGVTLAYRKRLPDLHKGTDCGLGILDIHGGFCVHAFLELIFTFFIEPFFLFCYIFKGLFLFVGPDIRCVYLILGLFTPRRCKVFCGF